MNPIITTLQEELEYRMCRCLEVIAGEGHTQPARARAKATFDVYYTIKELLEELIEENA
ncbi:hypothetical protein [Trueperella pyogenes]